MYDRIFQFNKSRPSRILIRRGLEQELGHGEFEALAHRDRDGIFLIYDPNVSAIADRLQRSLPIAKSLVFAGGESAKQMPSIQSLAEQLISSGASRHSVLWGLGGGVTTDVTAFLAATFMRGIGCSLLPTSLLAMVDASLGGKNGVDLGPHKNILGTINQPDFVFCDPNWLKTLSDYEFKTGLAEVIKKASILDEERFEWLEEYSAEILARDPDLCEEMIEASAALKMGVVIEDEGEAWRRMLLNFGHTVGHAYEGLSRYQISHGQAVAMGMVIECRASGSPAAERIAALLKAFDLPFEAPDQFSPEEVWALMQSDKKVRSGEVRIAVPTHIGAGRIQSLSEGEFFGAFA